MLAGCMPQRILADAESAAGRRLPCNVCAHRTVWCCMHSVCRNAVVGPAATAPMYSLYTQYVQ
jgi:hypothetical protein